MWVSAHDPKADRAEVATHRDFRFFEDVYSAVEGAEVLVMITPWPEYKSLDFSRVRRLMSGPLLIDTANLLDAHAAPGARVQVLGRRPGPQGLMARLWQASEEEDTKMRIAIIGAGLQCRRRAPAIKESKDDQLVVIASLHQEHAQEIASKMDCEASNDWRSAVTRRDVDAVASLYAAARPRRDRHRRNEGR